LLRSFSIVVDSSCDLPLEFMKEHEIEVMPMPFDLDGVPHDSGDWRNISAKEFYDALKNGSVAQTSQINPNTYYEFFTEYAKQGRDAIFLILSSGLSSTYQNAVLALQDVKESYPDCNIFPIDSLNATTGHGLLTMLAVNKRNEGLSASETAAWLEERKNHLIGLFTVDDLMFLHRGGRLSKLSAITGSVLRIKPVLNFAPDGTLCLKDRVRGRKAALDLMVSQFKRCVGPGAVLDTITISHTDCLEDADVFTGMIREAADIRNIVVMMLGPVIGSHLGPGAVTIVFESDLTRSQYEEKFG